MELSATRLYLDVVCPHALLRDPPTYTGFAYAWKVIGGRSNEVVFGSCRWEARFELATRSLGSVEEAKELPLIYARLLAPSIFLEPMALVKNLNCSASQHIDSQQYLSSIFHKFTELQRAPCCGIIRTVVSTASSGMGIGECDTPQFSLTQVLSYVPNPPPCVSSPSSHR